MLVTVTILNVWWTEWDDIRLSLSLFVIKDEWQIQTQNTIKSTISL